MKKLVIISSLIVLVALAIAICLAESAHAENIDLSLVEKYGVDIIEPADQEALAFLAKIDRACHELHIVQTLDEAHRVRRLNELGQIARGKIMEAIRDELEPTRSLEGMHNPLPEGKVYLFLLRVAKSLPAYVDQKYGDKDGKLNEDEQTNYAFMLQFSNIGLREFALLVFEYGAVPPLSEMSATTVAPATSDPFPVLPPVVKMPETPPDAAAEPEAPASSDQTPTPTP